MGREKESGKKLADFCLLNLSELNCVKRNRVKTGLPKWVTQSPKPNHPDSVHKRRGSEWSRGFSSDFEQGAQAVLAQRSTRDSRL